MQHIKILDVDMNMNICTCFPVIPPNKNKVMEKSNFLAAVDFQPVEASKFPSPKKYLCSSRCHEEVGEVGGSQYLGYCGVNVGCFSQWLVTVYKPGLV